MYFALIMTFIDNVLFEIRERLENILRELSILNPDIDDDSDSEDDREIPPQMYS